MIQPLGVSRRCNTFASSGKTAQLRAAWWMCPATLLSGRTDACDFPVLFGPTPSLAHCVMLNRVVWYIGVSISEDPTASIFRREEWFDCPTLKTCWYPTSRLHCVHCLLQCPFVRHVGYSLTVISNGGLCVCVGSALWSAAGWGPEWEFCTKQTEYSTQIYVLLLLIIIIIIIDILLTRLSTCL